MEDSCVMQDTNKTSGRSVTHTTFGVGTIVALPENGENVLVVKFPVGIKRLGLRTARKFITTDNSVLQQMIDNLDVEDKERKELWIAEAPQREAARLAAIEADEEQERLEKLHRLEEERELRRLEELRQAIEEEKRKLEEIRHKEAAQLHIKNMVQERGITRLCHLTPLQKIPIILADPWGIRATEFIPEEHLRRNDNERYDNQADHISCSVQYPNVKYYWRKQFADRDIQWAVMFLSPEVITTDTLYCKVNAATRYGYYISKDFNCLFDNTIEYQKFDAAEQCYANNKIPRAPLLPSNVPTHEQAEILPYKNIPVQYITGIAFNNGADLETTKAILEKNRISYPDLYCYPALFDGKLHENLRKGIIPPEGFKLQGVKF